MTRFVSVFVKVLVALAIALMTTWAALAAYWSDIPNSTARAFLAFSIVLATILNFVLIRHKSAAFLVYLAAFVLFTFWWCAIEPSNGKNWQPDVAVLPYAEVDEDTVTVRNIRNFAYRTETDYTPRYYDKTFNLKQLDSVDLIAVYWMGDAIAHVMMSFSFAGKDYLCFSIETRKEVGQEYSSLKGFFKQYELIYVAADERDVIRLRTDFRRPAEDVYIYRTRVPAENVRKLFLEYVKQMNGLRVKPEFYNTITTNCTTDVVRNFRAFGGNVRYNWKILLSGYAPEYAYEMGSLDDSLAFEELKARSYVNPKVRAIGDVPDFSEKIREGLPVRASAK
ncbi:Lnb N-terminal periplasmic domain-containing protein [Desulfovibrio sp. TomC]|uniref:Lnb N-terminal periplasmic domain-containing protein n=1 Tax=Desulfovibrio sp. TomC TaxID=1562888 RepID=UPI0005744A74|nr:DUF4105 domain-containing protein [Desulfovibrio sp. TomC]KHK02599.1 putative membrane protein [Desulfovibrio sp. TomC]